ncbi:MAG: hypothetical protein GX326_05215 [Clostridiaceae bacterium]|nr:hypothetical protein [Clostridiaceae bacterium]
MLCQKCQNNEANVSVKTQINGLTKTYNLCSSCAKKEGFLIAEGSFGMPAMTNFLGKNAFSLPLDFNKISSEEPSRNKLDRHSCPKCNQTFQDFKKTGLFGCPYCYQEFREVIESILTEIHGCHEHLDSSTTGKNSTAKDSAESNFDESFFKIESRSKTKQNNETKNDEKENSNLMVLKKSLQNAIELEDYEQAAVLRDKIKAIENDSAQVDEKEEE